jgi:spermidine synthase
MKLSLSLFLIIFLEGYIVLSSELLAMRQLIPFAGSGTDTISIIIAAVLMPLAFGYYSGGKFIPKATKDGVFTIRKKLLRNLTISSAFLAFGLSYSFLKWLFDDVILDYTGIKDHLFIVSVYCSIFLVTPIYLLGQTVPLISNYFTRQRLASFAGKILFYSTLGSFMGSIFCTLVLMAYLGVHNASIITLSSILVLSFVLSKNKFSPDVLITMIFVGLCIYFNSPMMMQRHDIVSNNKYQLVQVEEHINQRVMRLNHSFSSSINKRDGNSHFLYVKYIENLFIKPMLTGPKKDVLVMGAGGFTVGLRDKKNNYIYIDLDPDLQRVAEEEFLEKKLDDNKKYVAQPARAFLYQTEQKFDLIVLDLFNGPSGSPDHLVTVEFFQQVKDVLNPGGIVVSNFLTAPNFSDLFSVKLDNTFRRVFPNFNRRIMRNYNAWDYGTDWNNALYIYYDTEHKTDAIYTDNLNSSMFDKSPRFGH